MPITVPESVARQARWSGYVEPEPGLSLPCTVLRGRPTGPRLLVTAGIHGAEYSSIEAARRLTHLKPEQIAGELFILPVVNLGAFWSHRPYVDPRDGKNLNRMFPGDPEGSESQRLAAWIVRTAMTGMDAYIDLHCGDIIEALTPFAIYLEGHAASMELAVESGLPYVVRGRPGGNSYGAAAGIGVPGVLLESGGNGLWSEKSVGLLERGVRRIMAKLGMLPDAKPELHTPVHCRMAVTFAPVPGFWHPAVTPATAVAKGALLGTIHDLVGDGKHEIRAEHAGPVLYHVTSLAISTGEPLVGVGVS